MKKKFEIDFEHWQNSNIKVLELIHTEAKEAFNYTIEVSKSIHSRSFTLIAIIVSVVSIIIGLVGSNILNKAQVVNTESLIVAIIISVPSLYSLIRLISNIFPRAFMHAGREPEGMIKEDLIIKGKYSEDEQYINILLSEIEALQIKIDYNTEVNTNNLKTLKNVIIWIIIFLSLALLSLVAIPTHNHFLGFVGF